ncbi:asparaginase [Achromobacter denitrificans]
MQTLHGRRSPERESDEEEGWSRRQTIVVLATGGTIASTAEGPAGMAEYKVTESIDALAARVPGLDALGPLRCEPLWNVESHAIGNAMLLQLAERAGRLLADPSVGGLVITHGTDTLEETAFFLDQVLDSPKPVVVTGAMRPASALSADGPLNLYNAVLLARQADAGGRGTLVLLDDCVHEARHAAKAHTTALHAFTSGAAGCAGQVHDGRVRWRRPAPPAGSKRARFDAGAVDALPRVDIVYDHQDADACFYAAAIAAGARGIVIAGCGNGSLSPGAQVGARRAAQAGIPCVRSSRAGAGFVSPLRDDLGRGLVSGSDLNPQKARILLMLALCAGADLAGIQAVFDAV